MVDCKECKNYNICEIRKMVEGKLKHCQSYEQKKPQTNAERIRAVNDEELAEFLVSIEKDTKNYRTWGSAPCCLLWLKSEVKE